MTNKIDIWPKDEAFRELLQAILNYKRINGSYETTKILLQEITREVVVREYHASRKEVVAAEEQAQKLSDQLGVTTDALEFYADGDNYKSRNGLPSAVAKDKGRTARDALLMISGTDVEVDDDEESE